MNAHRVLGLIWDPRLYGPSVIRGGEEPLPKGSTYPNIQLYLLKLQVPRAVPAVAFGISIPSYLGT